MCMCMVFHSLQHEVEGPRKLPFISLQVRVTKQFIVNMLSCVFLKEDWLPSTIPFIISGCSVCLTKAHIQSMTPRTDVCSSCENYRVLISNAVLEDEKISLSNFDPISTEHRKSGNIILKLPRKLKEL